MDIDLDKLEQAAKAAQEHGTALGCDWFTEQEASCNLDQADAAFVAAASPLVVLELIKHVRALTAAVQSPAGKFFAYDENVGFERFDSAEYAQAAAQASIDEYRSEAGDGWANEVENVCWGVVLGQAVEVDLTGLYEGGEDDERPVDFALSSRPVADRDAIRRVFLAHGFTVKDGQTDLKPYVYEAAEALLRELSPASTAPESGSQQ